MKRDFKKTVGEVTLRCEINWATSLELLEEVASPSLIVESIMGGVQAAQGGQAHRPEFEFNERNVVEILWIGCRKSGQFTKDELGDWLASLGWYQAYNIATEYLMAMVLGNKPQADAAPTEETAPAEK